MIKIKIDNLGFCPNHKEIPKILMEGLKAVSINQTKPKKQTYLKIHLGRQEWIRHARIIHPHWSHKKATFEYWKGDL